MWINRRLFETLMMERQTNAQDRAIYAVELAKLHTELRLAREEVAHVTTTRDWACRRVNHLERQFAATLYAKTGIELPIPKIEATPTEQTNPNMLPDFSHVDDDDPAFRAHPEWYSTGPEPFPLEETSK